MKKINQVMLLSGVLVLSLLSAPSFAAQSPIEITSDVNELVLFMDKDGKEQRQILPAEEITPGDRILFTSSFKNKGKEATENVMITNPIPAHTRYLEGTAKGENCIITFSVDGGKVWGDAKTLKVRQKDGEYRAATAADYTHIRWNYTPALQPEEKKSISFETRLL